MRLQHHGGKFRDARCGPGVELDRVNVGAPRRGSAQLRPPPSCYDDRIAGIVERSASASPMPDPPPVIRMVLPDCFMGIIPAIHGRGTGAAFRLRAKG